MRTYHIAFGAVTNFPDVRIAHSIFLVNRCILHTLDYTFLGRKVRIVYLDFRECAPYF